MEHDYYQILGVAPNTDTEVIAEAYRQCAMACHPDRGGSHEQMVLVSESEIIVCQCGQKLRVPSRDTKLNVSCPKCKRTFAQYGNRSRGL